MKTPLRHTTLALGLVLAIWACTPSPVDVNFGVVRFQPPEGYRTWWAEVEDCSHIEAEFERVTWYRVDGFADGQDIVGQWSPPHSISILRGREQQAFIVKHEVLHDLLQGDGFHDDPAWFRCRLLPFQNPG